MCWEHLCRQLCCETTMKRLRQKTAFWKLHLLMCWWHEIDRVRWNNDFKHESFLSSDRQYLEVLIRSHRERGFSKFYFFLPFTKLLSIFDIYDYSAWELSRAAKSGKKLVEVTLFALQENLHCEVLHGAWYALARICLSLLHEFNFKSKALRFDPSAFFSLPCSQKLAFVMAVILGSWGASDVMAFRGTPP